MTTLVNKDTFVICQTFEFTEVESFVFRSKLDSLSKEVLDVEGVYLLSTIVLLLMLLDLPSHLLKGLVVHVVDGPVHVVPHPVVEVVKVFLGDHVVPEWVHGMSGRACSSYLASELSS